MNTLVSEGFTLMLLGMGAVFVFLALLVVTTQWMSALASRFIAEPLLVDSPLPAAAMTPDPHLLRVLTVAIATYKKNQQR